ncbi:MAG: hypothetical protein IH987_03250 [Planctomycetes bacterium]|nr:hypothetical protein [Planctomycetota bacterium]
MQQKGDFQEKQNSNKTGQFVPQDRSGDGLRPNERSVGARADAPELFQPIPLKPCVDCAATYDPDTNYAHVLASLLPLLATHDAERRDRPAHQRAR